MRFCLISFLIFLMVVLPACQSEDDNYAGLGKLIAERNKLRYQLAEESRRNKGKTEASDQKTGSVSKEPSTNVLAEKKIVIVDIASGTPIGQGIAYINKKGEIVKIKLAN